MRARKVDMNGIGLFTFSIGIGLRFPFSKLGLTRLLIPMDIARYFEIPETVRALNAKRREKVLDLSSPKLLAVYLAKKTGCKIEATDIYKKDLDEWQKLLAESGEKITNLTWKVVDGRKLTYEANSFDKAYSISVLEHIEGKGDSKAIKELARVLKPGGVLVITVPVNNIGKEGYIDKSIYGQNVDRQGKLFWARRYTPETLRKRLVKPSGLKLKKLVYCYEKYPKFTQMHSKLLPWSVFLGWLYPLLARISLERCFKLPKRATVANALIVLTKPKV